MDLILACACGMTVVNIALLSGVLYPAAANFSKTRSSITGALMTFAVLFLVQNIVALFYHLTVADTSTVELWELALTVLQTAGLGTLFWVTYK